MITDAVYALMLQRTLHVGSYRSDHVALHSKEPNYLVRYATSELLHEKRRRAHEPKQGGISARYITDGNSVRSMTEEKQATWIAVQLQ
jgi:hypothetical protein